MQIEYEQWLKKKVVIAPSYGFRIDYNDLNPLLFPHQKDIVDWALYGGRRAIFASFGLGKSMMQLEIANHIIKKTGKPFIIVCPLAAHNEFREDNEVMGGKYKISYITDTDTIQNYEPQIYITNYERVRMGDIEAGKFSGSSFDEASILRNLQTETTDYVMNHFSNVQYRFVATATPTPNNLIEILNYAVFLGVISRGHALTRFFQRDSTSAGNLTLYPNKKKEFWQWVSTWAVFITSPEDLGYDGSAYVLPKLNIIEHCVDTATEQSYIDRWGEQVMFRDNKHDFREKAADRRSSIKTRCDKALELAGTMPSAIVWHELESERVYLEKLFKDKNAQSVFGSQSLKVKETLLYDFAHGNMDFLLTKKRIAGSGCNFQKHCWNEIFTCVDDKFNDFIQGVHRVYRFGQKYECNIHLIYTKEQEKTLKTLYDKWKLHDELNAEMVALIKEFGLNTEIIKTQMERQLFKDGKKITIGNATLYNNDTVIVHADKKEMPDDSVHMILTSIPFGDHYEYSDNYNDMGHNHGNDNFFEQMEFLTPNLYRILKPGRIAAIHVKDRIRYSYQNGTKFTTIDDFSGQTVRHFTKGKLKDDISMRKAEIRHMQETIKELEEHNGQMHIHPIRERLNAATVKLEEMEKEYARRFHLIGKITVTTDVVRENNQTYRLGWSEQCKDATKQGVGMPEYVLLFRKPPSHADNAYADEPVEKTKQDYSVATWQLDAHAYWRSDGNRFMRTDEIGKTEFQKICAAWAKFNKESVYSFAEHVRTCEEMEEFGKLSKLFMSLPVHSNSEYVWTDVNRMLTLNANQVNGKKEKHICPLQFDIIRRLINRFTMPGEIVDDPFGGLFSTPYIAMEMGRASVSCELNSEYYRDGVFYIKNKFDKINMPTLFDTL